MSSLLSGLGGSIGGGAVGGAVFELVLDASKYEEQLAAAKGDTETSTSSMGTSTAGFGSNATAAYAAAGIAAFEFAKHSIDAAVGLQAAQEKLANSIDNSKAAAGASEQAFIGQADAIARVTGVTNDQIITGQALLVQMGLTADQVKQLTPLVVDLAVKNNIDLQAAFKAVGKAAEGSTGALARYLGPITKGKTDADTYANVLRKLGGAQGFAAQEANAQPWKLLGEQFHELAQQVGTELLPTVQSLVGGIIDVGHALGLLDTPQQHFDDQNTVTTKQIQALSQAVIDHNLTLNQAALRYQALNEQMARNQYGTLTAAQQASFESAQALSQGEQVILGGMQQIADQTPKTGAAIQRFAGDSKKELDAFASSMSSTIDQTFGHLNETVKNTYTETPKELAKAFQQMLAVTVRFKTDEAALLALKPGTFGLNRQDMQAFEQFLLTEGPSYVDAFVRSSKAAQQQEVAQWQQTEGAIAASHRQLQHALSAPIHVRVTADLAGLQGTNMRAAVTQLIQQQLAGRGP